MREATRTLMAQQGPVPPPSAEVVDGLGFLKNATLGAAQAVLAAAGSLRSGDLRARAWLTWAAMLYGWVSYIALAVVQPLVTVVSDPFSLVRGGGHLLFVAALLSNASFAEVVLICAFRYVVLRGRTQLAFNVLANLAKLLSPALWAFTRAFARALGAWAATALEVLVMMLSPWLALARAWALRYSPALVFVLSAASVGAANRLGWIAAAPHARLDRPPHGDHHGGAQPEPERAPQDGEDAPHEDDVPHMLLAPIPVTCGDLGGRNKRTGKPCSRPCTEHGRCHDHR